MDFTQNDPYAQIDPYAPSMKRMKPNNNNNASQHVYKDEVVILKEKVTIPVDKYPGYNFVGAIIGPSGSILKELCQNTRSKIAVLGKGSMKDKSKEEELLKSEDEKYAHLKEPLHVLIDIKAPRSEAHRRMSEALLEVYKFMVPPDQMGGQQQQHFQQQQQQQFNQGYIDGFGGGFPHGGMDGAHLRGESQRGGFQRGRGGPMRGGGDRGRGGNGRGNSRGGPRGGSRGGPRGRSRGGPRGGF